MKNIRKSIDDNIKLYNNIVIREKLENQAAGTITSEILSKLLKDSKESLPQKIQKIIQDVASNHSELGIDRADSYALSLRQSREKCEELEDEYEILKLNQKNAELQLQIDQNKKFLDDLRRSLACSKESLASQDPNPANIEDYIRKLKQKVALYEESCAKSTMKLSKLSVPESIYPMSLASLIATRDSLAHDEETLRLRANDVMLTRQARDAFNRLRK